MLGYYKKPEATAEVLRDGWFYTGDLGYRDQDGYFFITGRSKEMIVLVDGQEDLPRRAREVLQADTVHQGDSAWSRRERGLEAAVVPDFDYLRKMNLSNSRETIAFETRGPRQGPAALQADLGTQDLQGVAAGHAAGEAEAQPGEGPVPEERRAGRETGCWRSTGRCSATPVGRKFLACLEPFSQKKNIVPDDNLELDLGLDSLARVELVVSIEKTFGVSLPDSFGSEIFTVKEAVLRIQDLVESGTVKAGERVRLSWAEILAQEPAPELRETLRLDQGAFCTAGRALLYLFVQAVMRIVYPLVRTRTGDTSRERVRIIIAPNHVSLADAPAIIAALPWRLGRQAFFLGATEYFGGRLTSRMAKVVQVIPVDMDTKLYRALCSCQPLCCEQGKVLCVFPEGTRSRDGRIKEFKKGVGIIARELNIPLVPVAITRHL